jgi:hypothetical protein
VLESGLTFAHERPAAMPYGLPEAKHAGLRIEGQDSRSVESGNCFSQEAIAMADVRKAVQWRSCPKGHFYLGQECPCEHLDRYRASFRQVACESSGLETDRVPGAGRRLLLGVAN